MNQSSSLTDGIKFDTGKNEYGLIPAFSLDEIAKCLTYGAKKYAPDNWRVVDDSPRRYFDAAQRHMWAIARGEQIDPESGIHHCAHAIVSLMFLHEHLINTQTKPSPIRRNPKAKNL